MCLETHFFLVVRPCLETHWLTDRHMGWLRSVGPINFEVSFVEYHLFYRALLQQRPIILSILPVILPIILSILLSEATS